MSEFLLDEAMGVNRLEQADQRNMLLRAGEDESHYDNFYRSGVDQGEDRQRSGTIIERRGGAEDDDFQTAADGQSDDGHVGSMDGEGSQLGGGGLIEEEPPHGGAPPQLPGVIHNPVQPAGPVTHYSNEAPQRMFNPDQWRTGRSDKVMGKYWSTFGERKRAAGGGFGGFFRALFGRGMARANRLAEKRAFERAPLLEARAWRQQRRAEGAEAVPARSAMKPGTGLEGPPITDLSTFPRERGVQYDEEKAAAAHAGFMRARAVHHDANEDVRRDALLGNIGAAGEALGKRAEGDMKGAHADYDIAAGNQTLFAGLPNPYDDKAVALADANRRAGADVFANMGRPRRTPQRVRFRDGADDQVGQPVNDPEAGPGNKPMPSSVRFFPAPITMRSFRRDVEASYTRLRHSPEFRALPDDQQAERKQALVEEHMGPAKKYVESAGKSGHPDEISDEQAMENARFAWPIRAQMLRMNEMGRSNMTARHELNAMNLEHQANLAKTDPLESDEFRDQYLRANIGNEAQQDLQGKRAEDQLHTHRRSTDTSLLGPEVKQAVSRIMHNQGMGVDPNVDLAQQMPRLPRNFFDSYLEEGWQEAREAAGGGAGGVGGGGLIEEEPQQ